MVALVGAALLVLAPQPTVAQTATPPAAPALSDAAVLAELKLIRQLLEQLLLRQASAAPAPDSPDDEDDPDRPRPVVTLPALPGDQVLGRADAPLTMVEFTDLECPFCRHFQMATFAQLQQTYIQTGKLRFVSRSFPLDSLHPQAEPAARAARCAGDQGSDRYWAMRRAILLNNQALHPGLWTTLAQDLRLDLLRFQACLADTARHEALLAADRASAAAADVDGTPAFVLGRTQPGGGVQGTLISGTQTMEELAPRIEALLQPATASGSP